MDSEKDLKDVFRDEALELLGEIDLSLIQLVENKNDSELVNTIFRALHTIKGSGSMFGFTELTSFTHAFESVFDRIRKGTAVIDEDIIDLSLEAEDGIRNLLLNEDTTEGKKTRDEILRKLESVAGNGTAGNKESEKLSRTAGDTTLFKILFSPNEDFFGQGIDFAAVLKELASLGECRTKMNIDKIPPLDKLDCEKCYVSFFVLLDSCEEESRVKKAFEFVSEESKFSIEKIDGHIGEVDAGYKRIGEILVENKSISCEMIEKIKSEQKLFGEIAVEKGLASREDVENAIVEQTTVKNRIKEQQQKMESATIRVNHEKLDKLVDLVGEFVTMQARLHGEAAKRHQTEILSIVEGMKRLTDDLRDIVMKTRMVPVYNTFNEFNRLVFDLSRTLKKEIRLDISGGDTEIDKNVIEALKDPLMHLIRNASDHGIESPERRSAIGKPPFGTILLHAEHVGGRIVIKVTDDGAGLNPDLIRNKAIGCGLIAEGETDERLIFNTIFEPGFSTADKATSVSGRGVGMDVVKKNVEKLRGSVSLQSKEGEGMIVTLSIPLTLAIIEGLLTRTGNNFYILNLSDVQECVNLTSDVTARIGENNIINLRGETVPFVRLRDAFGIEGSQAEIECMVIVESEGHKIGLIVDQVTGKYQSVIKPLSVAIKKTMGVTGASILGDGSVALILDVREIAKSETAFFQSAGTNSGQTK